MQVWALFPSLPNLHLVIATPFMCRLRSSALSDRPWMFWCVYFTLCLYKPQGSTEQWLTGGSGCLWWCFSQMQRPIWWPQKLNIALIRPVKLTVPHMSLDDLWEIDFLFFSHFYRKFWQMRGKHTPVSCLFHSCWMFLFYGVLFAGIPTRHSDASLLSVYFFFQLLASCPLAIILKESINFNQWNYFNK